MWGTFSEFITIDAPNTCDKCGATQLTQTEKNAIECDRIERKLLRSGTLLQSALNASVGYGYTIIVYDENNNIHKEISQNKLEALRKAQEWVDKRGESNGI